MRTIEQIDITQVIERGEFCMIFEKQLPLNKVEKKALREKYFPFYALCVASEVGPAEAFQATKILFYSQETQILERCSPENSLNG
jgi:hypothetical protein